jgi:hypothetical protein
MNLKLTAAIGLLLVSSITAPAAADANHDRCTTDNFSIKTGWVHDSATGDRDIYSYGDWAGAKGFVETIDDNNELQPNFGTWSIEIDTTKYWWTSDARFYETEWEYLAGDWGDEGQYSIALEEVEVTSGISDEYRGTRVQIDLFKSANTDALTIQYDRHIKQAEIQIHREEFSDGKVRISLESRTPEGLRKNTTVIDQYSDEQHTMTGTNSITVFGQMGVDSISNPC